MVKAGTYAPQIAIPPHLPLPQFFLPAFLRATIKNDEMRLLGPGFVGVTPGLFDSLGDGGVETLVENLELNDHFLHRAKVALISGGPLDEKVGAASTQSVLAVDSATAVMW